MDIDASQYAEISREMAYSGDYLHIYDRGHNYLDKPPFLFWAGAMSMKAFGPTNFGYRFPSILFALLAIYATYRLAKLLYDETTGRIAALILATCQGLFLMTNDVRCDTILMGWVITAMWLIQEWVVSRKLPYLLLGSICIAFGMMTKGPIALMAPVFAFGIDWVLKRHWKLIFHPAHLLAILIIAAILIPMSIGLYEQYDLHPDKWIDGKQGTSGLRFFFWTQSFGRITGENTWHNGADFSFLIVNMLWSFLPWMFLFLPALWIRLRELYKQKFRLSPQQEWVSTGGFLLAYISLGSSQYQLPHYIFVVFPLAAISTAGLFKEFFEGQRYPKLYKVLRSIQTGVTVLLFIGVLLILTIVFPGNYVAIVLWVLALCVWIALILRKGLTAKTLWLSSATMILINLFLTHLFYYQLLQYQVGPQVGRYIKDNHIPQEKVMTYRMHDPLNSLHFYAQQVIRVFENVYVPATTGDYVLTMDDGLQEFKQKGLQFTILKQGELFKVSELTPDFLGYLSRHKATRPYYFIQIR